MGDESKREQSANFSRLARLLLDVGTEVLRDVLWKEIPKNQLENKVQQNAGTLKFLKKQRPDLFQKKPLDPTEFDISLLVALLTNICPNIKAPSTGWNFQYLDPNDRCIGAELLRIRQIRNASFHRPDTLMSESIFTQVWEELEAVILRIAGQVGPESTQIAKSNIEIIKNDVFDPAGEKEKKIFQEWQRQSKDILHEISSQNDTLRLDLKASEKKVELLQDQVTKNTEQQKEFQESYGADNAYTNQQLQEMQRELEFIKRHLPNSTPQPNQRQNSKSSQSDKNVGDLPDKDIGIIARKIGFEWEQLAFQLDFEKGQVDALKRIYRDQPVALNIRMIECWRDVVVRCGESPRTLLVAAFASLENNAMAQSLVPPKDVEKIKDKVARKETQSKIKLILFDI